LRYLQRSTYAEARKVKPAEQVHREMEMLMQDYITYLLERRLNTPAFLKKVQLQGNQS
jgi:5-methylcytosine-specific restriction endonuclease McrBC regulatory subunit McrC